MLKTAQLCSTSNNPNNHNNHNNHNNPNNPNNPNIPNIARCPQVRVPSTLRRARVVCASDTVCDGEGFLRAPLRPAVSLLCSSLCSVRLSSLFVASRWRAHFDALSMCLVSLSQPLFACIAFAVAAADHPHPTRPRPSTDPTPLWADWASLTSPPPPLPSLGDDHSSSGGAGVAGELDDLLHLWGGETAPATAALGAGAEGPGPGPGPARAAANASHGLCSGGAGPEWLCVGSDNEVGRPAVDANVKCVDVQSGMSRREKKSWNI